MGSGPREKTRAGWGGGVGWGVGVGGGGLSQVYRRWHRHRRRRRRRACYAFRHAALCASRDASRGTHPTPSATRPPRSFTPARPKLRVSPWRACDRPDLDTHLLLLLLAQQLACNVRQAGRERDLHLLVRLGLYVHKERECERRSGSADVVPWAHTVVATSLRSALYFFRCAFRRALSRASRRAAASASSGASAAASSSSSSSSLDSELSSEARYELKSTVLRSSRENLRRVTVMRTGSSSSQVRSTLECCSACGRCGGRRGAARIRA